MTEAADLDGADALRTLHAAGAVIARMSLAVDDGNINEVARCLHPQFTLNLRGMETDRAAFLHFLETRKGERASRHLLGPAVLRRWDSVTAVCGTSFAAYTVDSKQAGDGSLSPQLIGCYDDELKRVSGQWFMFRRGVTVDFDRAA